MTNYYMLLTPTGLAKVTNAQLTQEKVEITHVAVGNADGRPYSPTGNETALKREVWRGGVASIEVDEQNPNWIIVEAIVPSSVGGFTMREVALYDAAGDMIAIGNYPENYKPVMSDGSTMDLALRTIIEVNNAESVTLKIDPNVIVASRAYVDKRVATFGTDLTSLEERVTKQLDQKDKKIKVGKVELPSDFPKLPFQIFKTGDGEFTHNATPYNQHDWSTATEIFIANAQGLSTSDGTDITKPILISQFVTRYNEGKYNNQTNFILTFVSSIYSSTHSGSTLSSIPANFLIRSRSLNGRTIIGQIRHRLGTGFTSHFVPFEGVYKAIVNSSNTVDYPVNFKRLDSNGLPFVYTQVLSLTDCKLKKGTYFVETVNTSDIYVNPFDEDEIKDLQVARRLSILPTSSLGAYKIMFENITFLADTFKMTGTSIDSRFYLFNCKFYRGLQDAIAFTGVYKAYLFDCVASHASKDAFNYHTTSTDSLAIEVNCAGYGSGKSKFLGTEANATTGSNNGSTAHDGMHMLRVGCDYSECEGPIVADINNCYSISVGCNTYDILSTTTGIKAGYYVQCDTLDPSVEKPKYIIECKQSGKYFEMGINAVKCTKAYHQGFTGHDALTGNPLAVEWEDVTNE